MEPVCEGTVITVTASVAAALVPQGLPAVTERVPLWPEAPEFVDIMDVPWPEVIFQPVGTVHVYATPGMAITL